MNYDQFVQEIKNPLTFGSAKKKLMVIQTHISFVVLTGSHAYKIKKPVDFGFLDFSTLEKRKHFCHEELRLNSRLCPDLYEEVVQLTETTDGDHLEINGIGPVIEYAVKMKQFPQEHIMTELLQKNLITTKDIDQLIDQLVDFYNSTESNDEISSFGSSDAVKQNIVENFEQTENKIDITIPKSQFKEIREANELFFSTMQSLINQRKNQGFIKSCHGDLHSGNIVLYNDTLCVFDCIEFNKRFRYIDVASDIGFFAMDLDIQNYPFFSSYLIQEFIKKSGDDSLINILNLYKSYRAYVRGKVLGFQLDDPHIEEDKKQSIIEQTAIYFSLSAYYAALMMIQIKQDKPIVFMMSGLTGTGKSTIASKLAVDYRANVINTDVVRKKLEGVDTFERHLDDPNTGLYSPERVQKTYEQVLTYAEQLLKKQKNVVLDATFQKQKHRQMAKELAQKYDATFIPVFCTCPDEIAKKWLDERLKSKSVSDGRWEIYQMQKDSFELFTDKEKPLIVNTASEDYDEKMNCFNTILHHVKKDIL